ncbi:hypothetical protein EBQ34_14250 [Vandammella animalimorsus]|uniref:Uncharacterized protein n=1 Tax=Vandammella animalimorsus TaxID=2029117 RepID=A0A3M6R1A6_9BURK|nr:hypothetical protein EBQ34_14190 [Vandammella animalimorsus]RMX09048.1 hypothetical protein EBQ34_14250 [Vandammella animalimorsus]
MLFKSADSPEAREDALDAPDELFQVPLTEIEIGNVIPVGESNESVSAHALTEQAHTLPRSTCCAFCMPLGALSQEVRIGEQLSVMSLEKSQSLRSDAHLMPFPALAGNGLDVTIVKTCELNTVEVTAFAFVADPIYNSH